jgi:hypothetical protein
MTPGCQCDQRAPRHRVMRHEHCNRCLVVVDCTGDLDCGEHEAARRMQDDIQGHRGRIKNAFVRVIWAMFLAISRATAATLSLWKIVAQ